MASSSDLTGQRVLVTGGTGFIGRRVVDALLAAGSNVRVAAHASGDAGGAELAEVDLRDADAASSVVAGCEYVIHLAARQGGIQFQERTGEGVFLDNVRMTANILSAAIAQNVRRVVLASSAVVYSRDAVNPIGESAPLLDPQREPVSPYAWSKITDEVAAGWAGDRGLDVIRVRFANVYGPGASYDPANSTVVHAIVRKAIEAPPGDPIPIWGDGSAERSFVHVLDAARAVLAVLVDGLGGDVYNISSTGAVSIRALATAIRDSCRPDCELEFSADAPVGAARRVIDHWRLQDLGFEPAHDLASGIATVVADARQRLSGLAPDA